MTKTLTSSHSSEPSEPVIPSPSPQLSSPFFTKKGKLQEGAKVGIEKVEQSQTATVEKNIGKVNNLAGIKSKEDSKNQGEASSIGEVKNVAGNLRPANPFAKSPSNQEKSSLFDAIKKMKKTTDETSKR